MSSEKKRVRPFHWETGRKRLREAMGLGVGSSKADPFLATVFGSFYERLLLHYFLTQRTIAADKATWRNVGTAYLQVGGTGRHLPQDFLLEWPQKQGSSPRREGYQTSDSQLVCFEAKSWPAYRGFHKLTPDNVEAFLDENDRFLGYISAPKSHWSLKLHDTEGKKIGGYKETAPDAFGFLVFDFDETDRDKLLKAFRRRNPKLVALESICRLVSMLLYNPPLKGKVPDELRAQRKAVDELFSVLVGEPAE